MVFANIPVMSDNNPPNPAVVSPRFLDDFVRARGWSWHLALRVASRAHVDGSLLIKGRK
jgi:hypothetical protein